MIDTAGDRFRAVLSRVAYKDWRFLLRPLGDSVGIATYYLQVEFDALPAGSSEGFHETHRGRKWLLSRHMTDGEIVQTALRAVITAAEHEIREEFLYKGQPIFGPHYDLEVLLAVCETGHNEERRAPTGDVTGWLKGQDHDQLLEEVRPLFDSEDLDRRGEL